MRIFVSTILLAATLIAANAGDIITATVIVSDADELTNNASITLGSDTRIWTNSVTTPATQIRSSTTEANAAFNLLQHFRAYPFADVQLQATNNGVVFIGEEGGALDLTITNAWATVAYRTNTVSSATVVRVPYTVEPAANRVTTANRIKDWLGLADEPVAVAELTVNDDAYDADWNGSTNVPTKNALYDKIETIASSDDQTAAEVASTPAGNLAADDVQEALNELDTEKAPLASPTFTGTVTVPDNSFALGTKTTGNYVSGVSGTAGEISVSHTPAEGSTATISLPSVIDLGGKVLEIPNGAAPTTDADGEFALDTTITDHQPLLQYFAGSTEYVVIALPRANLDNTDGDVLTYEAASDSFVLAPAPGAGGGDSVTVDGAATSDPDFDDGGDINFTYSGGTITAAVKADSVALGTDTTGNYAAGDAEAGGATKITQGNTDATLSNAGEIHFNTADEQLSVHSAADGEISGEASLSFIQHRSWIFDPDAVCDGAVDRLFLMTVGDQAPEGIKIVEWKVSFEADPTTEADLDLKYADAFIGVANATLIDVLDTTAGVSSEDTNANINSGNAIANGKVLYLEFGTAYTESNHQIIFELWYVCEED